MLVLSTTELHKEAEGPQVVVTGRREELALCVERGRIGLALKGELEVAAFEGNQRLGDLR